jgi:hypothetical protein
LGIAKDKRNVVAIWVGLGLLALVFSAHIFSKGLGLEKSHYDVAELIVTGGGAIWLLRTRLPMLYGIIEIVFAFLSGLAVARDMTRRGEYFAHIVTMFGCAYIVSRGIGNVSEALKAGNDCNGRSQQ